MSDNGPVYFSFSDEAAGFCWAQMPTLNRFIAFGLGIIRPFHQQQLRSTAKANQFVKPRGITCKHQPVFTR
jgi:hypothetical protein